MVFVQNDKKPYFFQACTSADFVVEMKIYHFHNSLNRFSFTTSFELNPVC